jgi:hypothetical protein
MIDRTEAEHTAREKLAEYGRHGVECVLLDEHTLEEPFGWVFFFYQSAAFVRTGEPSARLASNSPLVVFRDTGEIRPTGTAHPLEHYLEPIRREWAQRQAERR